MDLKCIPIAFMAIFAMLSFPATMATTGDWCISPESGCDLSTCTSNCTCAEGGCDIGACESDCSCDGGACDMSSVPSSGVGYNDSSCKGGGCELSKNTLIKERNDGTDFCGTFQDPCYSDNFMFAECASIFGTACTCDSDGDKECDLTGCSRDCTCKGSNGGCDMSECTEDCKCEGGNCDMPKCVGDCDCEGGSCDMPQCVRDDFSCSCKGGSCDMSKCPAQCECSGGDCDMDTCVKNNSTDCINGSGKSAAGTAVVSTAGIIFVGLLSMFHQL